MRHLRWWADKPISDRDGVLSIGFTYDNRQLSETHSSAGSPYWAMKAFGALAAPADHPFWATPEEPLAALAAPIVIADAGQVITRSADHAVVMNSRPAAALEFPEQAAAKYRKFAYSSAFGFSGDVVDMFGSVHTDSMLALTDSDGDRRVCLGVDAAGVESTDGIRDGLAYLAPLARRTRRFGLLGCSTARNMVACTGFATQRPLSAAGVRLRPRSRLAGRPPRSRGIERVAIAPYS